VPVPIKGDVIIKLDAQKVNNIDQFAQKLEKLGVTAITSVKFHQKKPIAQPLNFSPSIIDPSSTEQSLTEMTLHSDSHDDNTHIIESLKDHDAVVYIEPVYPVTLFSTPNDPRYTDQAYMKQWGITRLLRLPVIQPVIVAVIDSGIDYYHEDLSSMIQYNHNEIAGNGIDDDKNGYIDDFYGYNFSGSDKGKASAYSMDEEGHGTHIAGIIAAKANNGRGISGVTNGVRLLPVRFLDKNGQGNQIDAAAAIRYAVDRGADIINCSWGFFRVNTVLKEAIQYAIDRQVIVIAAVGNSDTSIPEYPASLPGVITVGSVGQFSGRSYFSSYGTHLDFMYIGQNILGPAPHNTYTYKSGTSQSTAFVTGIAAALLAAQPTLTPEALYAVLKQSTSSTTKSQKMGYGLIDISVLLSQLGTPLSTALGTAPPLSIEDVFSYPNPIRRGDSPKFKVKTTENGAAITIRIYTPEGHLVDTLGGTSSGKSQYTEISWNPNGIKNGTYLYHVSINGQRGSVSKTGKCTILQ
jgi:subtilisin family serine protease